MLDSCQIRPRDFLSEGNAGMTENRYFSKVSELFIGLRHGLCRGFFRAFVYTAPPSGLHKHRRWAIGSGQWVLTPVTLTYQFYCRSATALSSCATSFFSCRISDSRFSYSASFRFKKPYVTFDFSSIPSGVR